MNTTTLYRTIWRWHFYAGLFCIPFVLTLAISGAIYLFKPQIDALVERPFHNIEPAGNAAPPNEVIAAALASVPGAAFLNYRVPATDRDAAVVSLTDENGNRILTYVDPYRLEVARVIGYDDQFIRQVRTFHGELLAGNFGSILIELAGNWAIVLIISGLYLWWPRGNKGFAGVLYPRLNSRRFFWRDLHAALGIWVSLFALVLLVSGLPWTLVWNSAFTNVREALQGPQPVQEWTVSRAQEHAMHAAQGVLEYDMPPAVLAAARELNFAAPGELSIAKDRPGQWHLTSDHGNRLLRDEAWIAGSGTVTELRPYREENALDFAIGAGISAHEGQLFGWLNQALALFTALALLTMSISGFMMWRKRRPEGVLGAPVKLPEARVTRFLTFLIFALALVLPLLALSLLVLWLLEWTVLKRLPSTRRWLGLANPATGEGASA